ncbi:hypothetical protein KJ903_04050 [Patescibacteria group bacterium]|nr:hypothetical protein [Patescibacteria group bacterium]
MFLIQIVGYIAGTLTLFNMFPQVIKTYRTKRVTDISYLMVITYVSSTMLWVIYAHSINSWPIMITNGVSFVVGLVQLILMGKYKKVAKLEGKV